MLNTVEYGATTPHPALLIVHGLYGSARNWGAIAKRMSDDRRVIAVDMRNHGESFRAESQGYPAMAADLAEVIRWIAAPVDVIGHSMGGKAAMQLALTEGSGVIQVSGIIRPDDVSPNNMVQSRRLANAQIAYRGTGDMANAAKPGWGTKALLALWPF